MVVWFHKVCTFDIRLKMDRNRSLERFPWKRDSKSENDKLRNELSSQIETVNTLKKENDYLRELIEDRDQILEGLIGRISAMEDKVEKSKQDETGDLDEQSQDNKAVQTDFETEDQPNVWNEDLSKSQSHQGEGNVAKVSKTIT